jgi:hypothetical protein
MDSAMILLSSVGAGGPPEKFAYTLTFKLLVTVFTNRKYRENFYFVDRFHGSALHGDRCTAGC